MDTRNFGGGGAIEPISIVGLGGSLAASSRSLAALEGAAEGGAETLLFDVRDLDFPMFTPRASSVPKRVRDFCDAVDRANGMIWSSPLYQGTISGSFKNILDWLQLLSDRDPPYLTNKVIGLISTAGGTQGLQAINTMEFIVRALRGWAVPLVEDATAQLQPISAIEIAEAIEQDGLPPCIFAAGACST